MKITLYIPEGATVNDYTPLELIQEIQSEVAGFVVAVPNDLAIDHKVIMAPKEAGGLAEGAYWIVEQIAECWQDEVCRAILMQFLKSLSTRAMALFGKKKAGEKTHRVEIEIGDAKLTLPASEKDVEEFLDEMKRDEDAEQ